MLAKFLLDRPKLEFDPSRGISSNRPPALSDTMNTLSMKYVPYVERMWSGGNNAEAWG